MCHSSPPLRKNIPALVRTLLGVGWCDLLSNTVEFLRNGLAWSASQMSGRCAALLTREMLLVCLVHESRSAKPRVLVCFNICFQALYLRNEEVTLSRRQEISET